MNKDSTQKPLFNVEESQALIGKKVLVGRTYRDPNGQQTERRHYYGIVTHVTERGIFLKNPTSGEMLDMPPDLRGYKSAPPGEYTVKDTGEVVVDPDLIGEFIVTREH